MCICVAHSSRARLLLRFNTAAVLYRFLTNVSKKRDKCHIYVMERESTHRDIYSGTMTADGQWGFFGFFFFLIVLVLTADWLSHVQGRGEISDNSPPVTAYHTI